MESSTPTAKSICSGDQAPYERKKLKRVVAQRGLCGLANDTKWDELLSAMQCRTDWRPRFRFKCVDGPASRWDGEWFYHLPFPLISVEWFDLWFLQGIGPDKLRGLKGTDHSASLEQALRQIGMEYQKGSTMIRIFGYSPKSLDFFDQEIVA